MTSLKGYCHEHRFKYSRVQKYILQQRKPTNTGVMKLKKSSIIVIPQEAQDPNLKEAA